jgi:hypothetical protein
VIPVGVRRQQALRLRKAGLLDKRGKQIELFGQHRRVDRERLGPVAHDRAVRLKQLARDENHVAMQRDGPHGSTALTAARTG